MAPRKSLSFLLIWLGVLLAGPTFAAPAGWWKDGWEARVPIAVEAPPGLLSKRPVVLRWGEIAEKLKDTEGRLSSLRLVADGELVPFQVDHRDARGDFLSPGNLTLEAEDELVFVAPADRQTQLYLYLSRMPKQPVTFPSGVKVMSQRRAQVHQFLSSGGLEIGVQGTGLLDLSMHSGANSPKGSVASVRWKGVGLNPQWMNWSIFMSGHPFPTNEENRWRMVKLLVDGPVRKVVAVSCSDSTTKAADGSVVLRADVTRYFSMFSDVPLYDVEDVARCSEVQENWRGTYTDRFNAGHARDAGDVLWDGSSGKFRRLAVAEENLAINTRGDLVRTDEAINRWYAWFDEKELMGLAVFYGPGLSGGDVASPAGIGCTAGWEGYASLNTISFVYKGLKAPTTLGHRFRVMGLGNVSPEQVAEEYRLWAERAPDYVTVGEVEHR